LISALGDVAWKSRNWPLGKSLGGQVRFSTIFTCPLHKESNPHSANRVMTNTQHILESTREPRWPTSGLLRRAFGWVSLGVFLFGVVLDVFFFDKQNPHNNLGAALLMVLGVIGLLMWLAWGAQIVADVVLSTILIGE
jgi:hypothetical protein